jgi:hypothetical protein
MISTGDKLPMDSKFQTLKDGKPTVRKQDAMAIGPYILTRV